MNLIQNFKVLTHSLPMLTKINLYFLHYLWMASNKFYFAGFWSFRALICSLKPLSSSWSLQPKIPERSLSLVSRHHHEFIQNCPDNPRPDRQIEFILETKSFSILNLIIFFEFLWDLRRLSQAGCWYSLTLILFGPLKSKMDSPLKY